MGNLLVSYFALAVEALPLGSILCASASKQKAPTLPRSGPAMLE